MRLSVVGGRRPILFDRRVRGHVQPIRLASLQSVAVAIADIDELKLYAIESLGTKIGHMIHHSPAIDTVLVWLAEHRTQAIPGFRRYRKPPACSFEKCRGESLFIL